MITYYVLALIGYALKGARSVGAQLDLDATLAVVMPVLLLVVWGVVHRIRKRFRERSSLE